MARSAGFHVLYEIMQRKKSDVLTFVGKGKFRMIVDLIANNPVDVLLVNGNLKPKQHFNLESGLKIECLDRVGLVLKIFSEMARNRKAKLQVERARLEYEIPLLREWIHSAKMGEHPGFLGGGKHQVDVYYRLIRKRKRKIEDELQTVDRGENLRRTHRKKRDYFLVGLAGYTNAGKSSLLRELTGERVTVDDRMFSTLSTTTRRLPMVKKGILISDTIGFIQQLPHFMIESFMTTIDDIFLSDLVLLLVDSSDSIDMIRMKLETSERILFPRTSPENVILVLNKIDKSDSESIMKKIWMIEDSSPQLTIIPISIKESIGLDVLLEKISEFFKYNCLMQFTVPNSSISQSFISDLYDTTDVESIHYDTDITLRIGCRERDLTRISREVEALGGRTIDMAKIMEGTELIPRAPNAKLRRVHGRKEISTGNKGVGAQHQQLRGD